MFRWVVAIEDALYARNLIKPYKDAVPRVLGRLSDAELGGIFAQIRPETIVRILVENYSALPQTLIDRVISALPAKNCVALIGVIANYDLHAYPVLMGIDHLPTPTLEKIVAHTAPETFSRLFCNFSPKPAASKLFRQACQRHGDALVQINNQSTGCLWEKTLGTNQSKPGRHQPLQPSEPQSQQHSSRQAIPLSRRGWRRIARSPTRLALTDTTEVDDWDQIRSLRSSKLDAPRTDTKPSNLML